MRLKAIADHNRVVRLEDWNGLDLAGNNDCASIVNAAMTQAAADGRTIVAPSGEVLIGSQIAVKAPIWGAGGLGGKLDAPLEYGSNTVFKCGGSLSGAAMFSISAAAVGNAVYGWQLRDIELDGDGQNAGGLVTTSSGAVYPSRFLMERVRIRNFGGTYGADIYGWIGALRDCYIDDCDGVCLVLRESNAVEVVGGEYRAAVNGWAIDLYPGTVSTRTYTVALKTTIESSRSGADGVKIRENVRGVRIRSYFEGHQSGYHIDIGSGETGTESAAAGEINISGSSFHENTASIRLDNVNGFRADHATTVGKVIVTAAARNIESLPTCLNGTGGRQFEYFRLQDSSNRVGRPIENVIVNPNGKGGVRGWHNAVQGAGAISYAEETTITRDGVSALRVTATTAGATGSRRLVLYPLNQSKLADAIPGKRLMVGAWVYISNVGEYAAGTAYPLIDIRYTDDGTPVTQAAYLQNNTLLGGWNWIAAWLDVVNDGSTLTDIGVALYPTNTTASPSVDLSIYVADLVMAVDPASIDALMRGDYRPSARHGVMVGESIIFRGDTTPTSTTVSWADGDRMDYETVTAGLTMGEVCTTPGAPGTWKAHGVIAA